MRNAITNTSAYGRVAIRITNNEKKKKCHGNRKLQHFKRKCRVRGLTEEQITTRIHNGNNTILEQVHETRKRKRDDQSIQNPLNSSTKSIESIVNKTT